MFGAQDIANLAGNEAERRAPSFQPKTVIIKMQYSDLQVTASFERLAPYPHPWNGARWFHGDFKLLAVEVHGEIIAGARWFPVRLSQKAANHDQSLCRRNESHGDFKLLAVEVHGEIIAESTSGADSAAATKK